MPDVDNTGTPARPPNGPPGRVPSRRAVLRGAAGAGAAGIAAATLGGVAAAPASAAARPQARDPRTAPDAAAADEGIVVHVRDAAAGQIDVFRGTAQTRLQDRDLAARLVRASR